MAGFNRAFRTGFLAFVAADDDSLCNKLLRKCKGQISDSVYIMVYVYGKPNAIFTGHSC